MDRRDDRGVQLQQRQEALGVLGHAAADDEEVGREEELHMAVEDLQPRRPVLPVQFVALLGRVGRPALDGVAVVVEVAELRVGHEHAVVEEGGADPGAERGQDRQTLRTAGGTVAHLGDAGGIRVVDEVDVAPEALLEELLRLEADPLLGDVRRGEGASVLDDRGEGDPERKRGLGDLERVEHAEDRGEHVVGRGSLGCGDLDAV
nr:hypothetical protein [Microbacterium sp. NIBRBAC000506063]